MFGRCLRRSRITRSIAHAFHKLQWSWKFYGFGGLVIGIFAGIFKATGTCAKSTVWCNRWKEQRFDARFGVNTADPVLLDRLDIPPDRKSLAIEYSPTPPVRFCQTISNLGIKYSDFVFVDLGSGKGRVLLLAAEFPFKRIIGVELSETLHRIAAQNIEECTSRSQKCRSIESICADVVSFAPPSDPTVFFLYNPFQAPVLAAVLDSIRHSIEVAPRRVIIVYHNPLLRNLLATSGFLVDLGWQDASWAIFEYRNEQPQL